jgi:hypothetical protein
MDDEDKARILSENFATLERLERRAEQTNEKGVSNSATLAGHFDPYRAEQRRRAAEQVAVR